jgi:CO dehydrogenase nickel-insertion accessory protein CooC1
VLVVNDGRVARDWNALGVSAVLPIDFGRGALLDALNTHAVMISRADELAIGETPRVAPGAWRGRLVAVTGPGGSGASTLSMALAQGFGGDARYGGLVVLADMALDADLAMLHDAGDVVPGVQELVDAHRGGNPSAQDIRALTFAVPDRHYQLMLGLRRHRDWTAIRPRAFAAALDNLRRAYKAVIVDIDPDLEGEDQCGSVDVEERNLMSRTTVSSADAVVIVGLPDTRGMHRLVRLAASVVELGVSPSIVVPVINRAPRSPRARAEITRAFTDLAAPFAHARDPFAPTAFVTERRKLDEAVYDATRLPNQLVSSLSKAVNAVIEHNAEAIAPPSPIVTGVPVPVRRGALGAFVEDELEET